jgi:uncharacterized protein YecE (DUF72 family)
MFEFSRFYPSDYEHGRDFIADLDAFLGRLPTGWPYAIEMRNKHWLQPEYFACLAKHRVAHVFNSWAAMPPVSEQMALPGSVTNPELVPARFLLKPGRKYNKAVDEFQPYDRLREEVPEARAAAAELIQSSRWHPRRKTYLYVNNRLEGSALETVNALSRILTAGKDLRSTNVQPHPSKPGEIVSAVPMETPVYKLPEGMAPGTKVRTIRFDHGTWEVESLTEPGKIWRVEQTLLVRERGEW